ncbi:MAG: trigger factor [Synergistaceae bacterium]|jgi:trigger factor|nr:trigger factor [Synergistaceae bacterium]
MRTELLQQEATKAVIKAEFDAEEFAAAMGVSLKKLAASVSVPGFRKGHVPIGVLEMRLSKEAIYEEAIDALIPKLIEDVTAEYDLVPVDKPDIKLVHVGKGEPLVVELTFEVLPEIELPNLEEIELERKRVEVTEDMVTSAIAHALNRMGKTAPVDRPVGEGDVVKVQHTARYSDDGELISQGGTELNMLDTRPEVRAVLLGKNVGDECVAEFRVSGRENAEDRPVRYEAKVEGVSEWTYPEKDAEFFKNITGGEADSEEAARGFLRKHIASWLEGKRDEALRDRAVAALVERVTDVPEKMLASEIERYKDVDAKRARERYNMDMDAFLNAAGMSREAYERVAYDSAVAAVRKTIALDALAKELGVELEREDIENEIVRESAAYGVLPDQLLAVYRKSNAFESLAANTRVGKAISMLMEKVRIKDVDEVFVEAVDAVNRAGGADGEGGWQG